MDRHTDDGGLIAALFDWSFTRFMTLRFVRLLYVLGLAGGALVTLLLLQWGVRGLAAAIAWVPLYWIGLRVSLEFMVVVFRMAEDISRLARSAQGAGPATGSQRP